MDEGGVAVDTDEDFRVPASLRSKTVAAIAADGRTGTAPGSADPDEPARRDAWLRPVRTGARIRRWWMPWMAAAAALVIALGAGSLAWTRTC